MATHSQQHSDATCVKVDEELEAFVTTINQSELCSIASSLREGKLCTVGERLGGDFNILFHLHFEDGTTWLARFPLPKYPAIRLKSEIATMKYVQQHSNIPVPEVYAYDSNPDNPVGVPYILMSKLPGSNLAPKWEDLNDIGKRKVLGQIADLMMELSSHRFPKIGSLLSSELDEYHVDQLVTFYTVDRGTYDLTFNHGPYSMSSEFYLAMANVNLIATLQQHIGTSGKEYG